MTENIIHSIENLLNEIEFAKTKKEIKISFISLMQIIDDNENLKKIFDKNVKDFVLIKKKYINEYNEILKHYSNYIKELKLSDIPIYFGFDFEFIDFVDFIYKTNENYDFDYSNGIFKLYDSLIYNLFYDTFSKYQILQENLLSIYNKIIDSYSYYYLNKRYENQMSINDRMGYYILVKTACINVLQELLKYIKKNYLLKKDENKTIYIKYKNEYFYYNNQIIKLTYNLKCTLKELYLEGKNTTKDYASKINKAFNEVIKNTDKNNNIIKYNKNEKKYFVNLGYEIKGIDK